MIGKLLKKTLSKSPVGRQIIKHDPVGRKLMGSDKKKTAAEPTAARPRLGANPNSPHTVAANRKPVVPKRSQPGAEAGANSGVGRLAKRRPAAIGKLR